MGEDDFESCVEEIVIREVPGVERLISIERLSGGASQETYRVSVRRHGAESLLALRRSRGGQLVAPTGGNAGIRSESLVFRAAREAGVPEPEIYYTFVPEDGLGDGFVMEWLEGETLGARIVRSDRFAALRPQLARECGRILARIHSIDVKSAGLDRYLSLVTPEEFIRQTWERNKQAPAPHPMIDYTAQWLLANLPENYTPALVHNDFRIGNIMVDENGIVAVLDWELAHIGDPMRDLGWICINSWRFGGDKPVGGIGEYADLFAGYEEVAGTRVDSDAVRYWQVFGSFWWAAACASSGTRYRSGSDASVERAAIARRTSEGEVDCLNLLIPGSFTVVEPGSREIMLDAPTMDELVTSVRDFLRGEVMEQTEGRLNFLARVAGNSLDCVLRELTSGVPLQALEQSHLARIYDENASLATLKWRLVEELRLGQLDLDDEALKSYLRDAVINKVAIDQPKYSGYTQALANGGRNE